MEDTQVWDLLARARAVVDSHYELGGEHRLRRFERFDPLADPVATEQLAQALAQRLLEGGYDLVAVWDDLADIVLGFVVGRTLQRPVVRVFDDEGLITASAPIPAGARAVFVTAALVAPQAPRLTRALMHARDATLTAVAALVDPGGHSEQPLALARLESYPPEQCPACRRGQPLANAAIPLAPGGLHG